MISSSLTEMPHKEVHEALGARWVVINGMQIPAHYGDVNAEELAILNTAGVFDFRAAR